MPKPKDHKIDRTKAYLGVIRFELFSFLHTCLDVPLDGTHVHQQLVVEHRQLFISLLFCYNALLVTVQFRLHRLDSLSLQT